MARPMTPQEHQIVKFLEDKEWLWESDSKRWDTPTISEAKRLAQVILPFLASVWDEGYTSGNSHNGRRDANPYRETFDDRRQFEDDARADMRDEAEAQDTLDKVLGVEG